MHPTSKENITNADLLNNIITCIHYRNYYIIPKSILCYLYQKMDHIYIFWEKNRKITNLIRNTGIQVHFETTNTILKQERLTSDKFSKSSIHQLTCHDCHKKYVGQIGSPFKTRFKKYIKAIGFNRTKPRYKQHILETGHSYTKIRETLNILHVARKGNCMNTLERLYICNITKQGYRIKHLWIS